MRKVLPDNYLLIIYFLAFVLENCRNVWEDELYWGAFRAFMFLAGPVGFLAYVLQLDEGLNDVRIFYGFLKDVSRREVTISHQKFNFAKLNLDNHHASAAHKKRKTPFHQFTPRKVKQKTVPFYSQK